MQIIVQKQRQELAQGIESQLQWNGPKRWEWESQTASETECGNKEAERGMQAQERKIGTYIIMAVEPLFARVDGGQTRIQRRGRGRWQGIPVYAYFP